ncbi:hypothetical protein [Parageobacillus thermoglucosidasius]|nr:hypothetical protein [Parageobacillus thermoglucosidasius]
MRELVCCEKRILYFLVAKSFTENGFLDGAANDEGTVVVPSSVFKAART